MWKEIYFEDICQLLLWGCWLITGQRTEFVRTSFVRISRGLWLYLLKILDMLLQMCANFIYESIMSQLPSSYSWTSSLLSFYQYLPFRTKIWPYLGQRVKKDKTNGTFKVGETKATSFFFSFLAPTPRYG